MWANNSYASIAVGALVGTIVYIIVNIVIYVVTRKLENLIMGLSLCGIFGITCITTTLIYELVRLFVCKKDISAEAAAGITQEMLYNTPPSFIPSINYGK